jgi:hypothetical protein
MVASFSANEKPDFPYITSERLSTDTESGRPLLDLTSLANLHGQLFAACILAIMLGIVGIRSGHKKSYIIHVSMQVTATLTALFGSLVGLKLSLGSPTVCLLPIRNIPLRAQD